MTKPICPKCGKPTEFTYIATPMDERYWFPVICTVCGTIVGQIPSDSDKQDNLLDRIDTKLENLLKMFNNR
ncbi:MAG: hypothetical protein Ta2B_13860 [Termitinemataceae bacterium]|nr:MAG: hypothetical protein Ta2B_13860 [Termitinemataceae bacterium]